MGSGFGVVISRLSSCTAFLLWFPQALRKVRDTPWAVPLVLGNLVRALVSAWSKALSSPKTRAEGAALNQQRILIPTTKMTRNNVCRGLCGGQVEAERQSAPCLVRMHLGQRLFLPNATEGSDSGRERGREGSEPTVLWLRVPKQPESVLTVSFLLWTRVL